MVLDRHASRHCLSIWRELINTDKIRRDQDGLTLLYDLTQEDDA